MRDHLVIYKIPFFLASIHVLRLFNKDNPFTIQMLKSVQKLDLGPDCMFQQDNDLKQPAKVTRVRFEDSNTKVMKRPRQSPDNNPVENILK